MLKAILIYGSTTGNTEDLAQSVASGLEEGGVEVAVKNVTAADVGELADYEVVVLGASTWGDGELQDDFVPFYDRMDNLSLAGKKAAAFGPGDKESFPDTFCAAVDMLEEKLEQCGAEISIGPLKIHTETGDEVDDAIRVEARKWALGMARSL